VPMPIDRAAKPTSNATPLGRGPKAAAWVLLESSGWSSPTCFSACFFEDLSSLLHQDRNASAVVGKRDPRFLLKGIHSGVKHVGVSLREDKLLIHNGDMPHGGSADFFARSS